jgi:starch synthase (maltosyl-transferring)
MGLTAPAAAVRYTEAAASARRALLESPLLAEFVQRPLAHQASDSEEHEILVERRRAGVGSWYEFFPRSEGARRLKKDGSWKSGTFRTAQRRLDGVAAMGFDVVYLPPIHPIGFAFRKGPNNTLTPGPHDPGSPWAIGSATGGHDAVHPDLGTVADFRAFVRRAQSLGIEIALDLALQASPDHPWVTEHPEWFTTLPDGTIAYAENPPKKYQDIYPINFDDDFEGLVAEITRIVRHWVKQGVRIFRVDNPHTKPLAFWERLIGDINATDPDVVFLAEAFTRPAMMQALAMVGFQQSYSYFTWRNTRAELEEFLTSVSHETADFMRPNLFVNTPDILTEYLQHGGPPAFKIRLVLAALLSPSYGIYSGYELCEDRPLAPGSEEYHESEKYRFKPRDWDRADSLAPYIARLNHIRRNNPALHRLRNLWFHQIDNDRLLCFSKVAPGRTDPILVVVNLDPHNPHAAMTSLDMWQLGLEHVGPFEAHDLLTDARYVWNGPHNYVHLDPSEEPAHILRLRAL